MRNLLIPVIFFFIQDSWSQTLLQGKSGKENFIVKKVTEDLEIPWGMTFLNSSLLLFTEKEGNLKLLNVKNKQITKIIGAPKVDDSGQGGFLDVIKDPKSDWIYFTYSKPQKESAVTALARAKLKDNKLVEWNDLLVSRSWTDTSRHFGSRIVLDKDYVYFTIGDRGHRPNGQDLKTHAGTVIRLHKDGKVPKDNPFVGNKEALDEIWSYGHRNPQGLVMDTESGTLWEIEHGPRGGDEINIIEKSKNYGWARVSHGKEYWGPSRVGEATQMKGMEDPVKIYVPSIAPCGLEIYSGKMFKTWKGNLFTGALAKRHLNRVILKNKKEAGEERLLEKLGKRIRNVKEAPDGSLYIATDDGLIMRMSLILR